MTHDTSRIQKAAIFLHRPVIFSRYASRYEIYVVIVFASALCVGLGLKFGQDANWDQLNYHYYAVYALLNGRLGVDIAPAQMQTWFNPLSSLLQYFLITLTPPRFATTGLALLAAIPIVLIYQLTCASLGGSTRSSTSTRLAIASAATIGAFSSPMFLSEIGTTFSDVFGATLILVALIIVIARAYSPFAYLLGGLFIGAAVGLKLTNALYMVGWLIAIGLTDGRRALRPLFLSCIGAFIAYIPTGGIWNIYIFMKFGNPLFPAYNNIFKSNLYHHMSMTDERFKPNGILDALLYFWEWPLGMHPTAEVAFRDVRFTLLLAAALIAIGTYILTPPKRRRRDGTLQANFFDARHRQFLLAFFCASFVPWLLMFGIQRYAVTLEMLGPLVLFLLLSLVIRRHRALLIASLTCLAAIIFFADRADWGRVAFSRTWFDAQIPDALKKDDTLFVMLSDEPIAYVVPLLPATNRFVRIEGNMPISPETGLGRQIRDTLTTYDGNVRSLDISGKFEKNSSHLLSKFGLALNFDDCADLVTKMGRLRSCQLIRE